jgi:hypothetical protein
VQLIELLEQVGVISVPYNLSSHSMTPDGRRSREDNSGEEDNNTGQFHSLDIVGP